VNDRGERLSADQAADFLAELADVGGTGMPLAPGLRAAAEEASNRRIGAALRHIAGRIEQGVPLADALSENAQRFPTHVAGLVAAALRTSDLGPALEELVAHHRALRETWWHVAGSLAYPLFVLAFAMLIVAFLLTLVVPVFSEQFVEFQMELPALTLGVMEASNAFIRLFSGVRKWLTLGTLAGVAAMLVVARLLSGAARWRRLWETTPLVGSILSWTGAAGFARMLAVLLEHEVPLPQALRLTADAVTDGNVRESCHELAAGVEDGGSLADLIESKRRLPATLVPFVRLGEQQGTLPAALRTASEVFLGRVFLRAALLRSVSPTIVFLIVGAVVMLCVVALFWPLMTLIDGLM